MAPGSRSGVRAMLAPARLAWLRVRRRPRRYAVVTVGVAIASAFLVAMLGASLVVGDRAVRRSLAAVPAEQRSFRVDAFALSAPGRPRRAPLEALALLSARTPVRAVEFRRLAIGGHRVFLTAVEQLPEWVRLRSGRLPHACRPTRCEMLALGQSAMPAVLGVPGLRVVVVGRGTLTRPAVLGDFAHPSGAALLAGSDVHGLSTLPALDEILRTESWVTPLAPTDVRAWQIERLRARETEAQALLARADPTFALSAPDDALAAAHAAGRLAAHRLLLVAGCGATLLLGFALLAALGLQGAVGSEWRRLEERGARRWQLWLFAGLESAGPAVAGVLAGALVGVGAAALMGGEAGVGAGAVLSHAVWTWTAALVVGVMLVVAVAALLAGIRARPVPGAGPLHALDLVALGAVATAAVAAARGSVGATELDSSSGDATLLLLFPVLVCLAGACLTARLLRPALRLLERRSRRLGSSTRLGLLALARGPARTTGAVAFLVVALALAFLATSYRATLARGARDEAAYVVPLDFTVTERTPRIGSLRAAQAAAAAPGAHAYPVLRRFADISGPGTSVSSPLLLGLQPAAIARVHGWRTDFGGQPPARLAGLLGAGGPVRLAALPLPRGTTNLTLQTHSRGTPVELNVALVLRSGTVTTLPLGARIPAGARLFGLQLALPTSEATGRAHRAGEDTESIEPRGTLTLGPLVARAGARRLGMVTDWRGWISRGNATVTAGTPVRLRYAFPEGEPILFRLRQPTDEHPLPVLVSEDVARAATPDRTLVLDLGGQRITGRIVAVARRFPGTGAEGSFVVADESRLQTALDADDPGTGRSDMAWLSVPSAQADRAARVLRLPPFNALAVSSRLGFERVLSTTPLARGIALTLAGAALLAALLAGVGLWLALLGDVIDERGEFYDLETLGLEPRQLRGQLRLRAGVLAAAGLLGGAVLGAVLLSQVVRLVSVGVSGSVPVPPLVLTSGWLEDALGLAALAASVAVLIELTIRRAFRGDMPSPAGEPL